MLEVDEVSVSFGAVDALHRVSLRVEAAEIVAILGANGAGKSTLLHAIAGVAPCRTGDIRIRGKSIRGLSVRRVLDEGIVLCPEGRQLFGVLTVLENLKIGATRLRMSWRKMREDIDLVLNIFPAIAELLPLPAHYLSGGQQQMVAIGRALMARPDILLLDEPTLGLAPRAARATIEALPKLAAKGMGVLMVEQNAPAAMAIASRVLVLKRGKQVAAGSPNEIDSDVFSLREEPIES